MSPLWAPIILAYTTINLPTDPPRAARWSNDFTVRYHVNSVVPDGLTVARFSAAVDAAFTTWERPCSTLRFERLVGGAEAMASAAAAAIEHRHPGARPFFPPRDAAAAAGAGLLGKHSG